MTFRDIRTVVSKIAVVATITGVLAADVALGQYTYPLLNTGSSVSWNTSLWSTGAPPQTSTEVGLFAGSGTMTIDNTSTNTTPGGLLVGWNVGNFTINVTSGSLTVGSTAGDAGGAHGLTLGESGGQAGTLSQSGGLVVSPVVQANGGTGVYNLNSGTLQTQQVFNRYGAMTFNFGGGTLQATGTSSTGLTGSTATMVVNAGGGTIDNGGFATIMNAPISGSGNLTLTGGGTTTYTANNTHSGTTTLSAGSLRIGNSGTTGNLSGPLVNNAAVIFDRSNDATYTGVISGNGTLAKRGAGTLVLGPSNTYTGLTTIAAGILQSGNNSAVGGGGTMAGGSYDVAANAKLVFSRNTDNVLFQTQSISGAGDVEFQSQAAGYYTFRDTQYSGTLSYTGQTIVNLTTSTSAQWYQNSLWLEKDNVLPNSTVVNLQSGKIYIRNQTGTGISVAGLTGNAGTFITTEQGGIQKWSVTVASGSSYAFAGKIGADGTGQGNNNISFTKAGAGTQILTSANSYTGGTTITGGRLEIASSGRINGTAGVTINGSGAELKYNSATALTQPITFTQGIISGTGAIGTGVTVATGDILAPGNSPGAQAYTSGLIWSPGGTYKWEINNATGSVGTNWDVLNVSGGALNLSGLSSENRFNLDLITLSGTASGPMANYVDGQSYSFALATYSSLALPTGFSGADLTSLFQLNMGGWLNTMPAPGNISVVNNAATSTINLVVVPEPTSAGLLAAAALAAGVARASRRRCA